MSRWFRHYAGMMRDEKLVSAAVRSKQPVERVVWVWGAILESAAEINDGGRFEFDAGEAAYFLRCDEADMASIVSALEGLHRINAGSVAQWSERQFDSDASRERQKRYRDRKREAVERSGDVTQPSRDGDVTPQETETDTEDSEPSGSDAASPVDAREILWKDGLSLLVTISGKTNSGARAILGKWLKASRDDCALVMSKIVAARDNRVGDPVSWITAAISPPNRSPPRPGIVGAAQRIIEETNGSEGIFGNHGNVELLPPASGNGQRDAAENLFGGSEGYQFAGRH